jgi:hypothetical protein
VTGDGDAVLDATVLIDRSQFGLTINKPPAGGDARPG